MGEIDFKKNKERTRELLKARMEKAEREEKIDRLKFYLIIIVGIFLILMVLGSMTSKGIKSCINHGNTKEYCERVLG